MSIKNRPQPVVASLESLENRRLLAAVADVTVLPMGNVLFFSTQASPNQWQLWQSNLDRSNQTLLHTFVSQPDWLVNNNGALLFAADDGQSGKELWTSDGSAAGTTLVKDIYPGSQPSSPQDFNFLAGHLIFFATDTTLNQSI